RHTRLQGDWSSDVCSSDLQPLDPFPVSGFDPRIAAPNPPTGVASDPNFTASALSVANNRVLSFVDATVNNFNGDATVLAWPPARSEERRVGKEWRARW